MGYRIDFENREITATGGIYVRTSPSASEVIFDGKDIKKPSIFSSSIFVQDLLPKQHTVLVKKDGYFDYYKNLEVLEKEVTKLETVTLFKDTTAFETAATGTLSFYLSPDKKNILAEGDNTKSLDFYYFPISNPENKKIYSFNLPYTSVLSLIWAGDSNSVIVKTQNSTSGVVYHALNFSAKTQSTATLPYLDYSVTDISFNPLDSNQVFFLRSGSLFSMKDKKLTTVLKKISAYKISDNNILWLSSAGALNQSDIFGNTTQALLAEWPFNKNIISPADYKIEVISGKIILYSPNSMYLYDTVEKNLKDLGATSNNFKISQSPDGKNMIYYSESEIYLYAFEKSPYNKTDENNVKLFSAKYGETISNCFWLNNDYIIFESGNRIIISEIDFRGNINQNELQKSWEPNADSKNPSVIFNQQDDKLYVLTGGNLYFSEKIIP